METQDRERYSDPLALAQRLIRCRSITPHDAGAMDVVELALSELGFKCWRVPFDGGGPRIENLYARKGSGSPNFCFAGHTDVVPPGDVVAWKHDPFAAQVEHGTLFGRGAADMKSAISAFIAAVARLSEPEMAQGSVSLLITGDEEGPAVDGTVRVLDWLKQRGEVLDHCIVGEPTSEFAAGDTIKIGRRGSLTTHLVVKGAQGHVGYPERARNPIPGIAEVVGRLSRHRLDEGTEDFQRSNLEVTTVDVGNPATNVIPECARATFNIRFNTLQSAEKLEAWIQSEVSSVLTAQGLEYELGFVRGAHPFLTRRGAFTELLSKAVQGVTGFQPKFSTTGGTSDARFIQAHCPVAEIGLAGTTMHKTDECVRVSDVELLVEIYRAILIDYFKSPVGR